MLVPEVCFELMKFEGISFINDYLHLVVPSFHAIPFIR